MEGCEYNDSLFDFTAIVSPGGTPITVSNINKLLQTQKGNISMILFPLSLAIQRTISKSRY